MKSSHFTCRQRRATLQTLRARKLLLDRAIRELEALASKNPLPPEERLVPVVPFDGASEQWLQ